MREAREVIEAALKANEIDMVPCDRCDGRGYHHGFGEHGHDPDWCVKCDGAQTVHSGVEPPDAILAALSSAGIDCEGWRTIESAPKDGTEFQAWCVRVDHGQWEPRCRFNPKTEAFEIWGRIDYDADGWDVYPAFEPTHWMPFPLPPLASEGG